MRRRLPHLALLALLHAPGFAQAPPAPVQSSPALATPHVAPGRQTVFLDPAHGGDDTGAHLRDQVLEKDVTLALANRLRFQLDALGLAVLATREADLPAPSPNATAPPATTLTTDQRAGLANHLHPFACIVFHATDSGSGVHILTAALPPAAPVILPNSSLTVAPPLRWEIAQADSLPQSEHLADELATSLTNAGLPINRGHASIRPLNNLTCPAVLIELAPLSRTQGPVDAGYQARVTQAIATALVFWHGHSEPASPTEPSTAEPHPRTGDAPAP